MIKNVTCCSYSPARSRDLKFLRMSIRSMFDSIRERDRASSRNKSRRNGGILHPSFPSTSLPVVGKFAGFVDRNYGRRGFAGRLSFGSTYRSGEFSRRTKCPRDAIVSSHLAKRRPGLSKRGHRSARLFQPPINSCGGN